MVSGIVTNPVKFDITRETPYGIYYGNGQGLPYSQYASTVPSRTNDLWISGQTNWTQYAVSPVGASLQLVANVPAGGMGGFYEVVQTDTASTKYKTYQFNPGYNTMNFKADQMGRTHALHCGEQPAKQCGHCGCVLPGSRVKQILERGQVNFRPRTHYHSISIIIPAVPAPAGSTPVPPSPGLRSCWPTSIWPCPAR